MHLAILALFAYVFVSLIAPLRIPRRRKIFATAILFILSQKNLIFQLCGGGLFFSQELPRTMLIAGGTAFGMFLLISMLLPFKDLAWLGFRIFHKTFPRENAAIVVVCAAGVLTLFGTFGSVRTPVVRTEEITLSRLPPALDGTKIALLADIHLSAQNRAEFARAVVEKTNALAPDLILVAGDFIDGNVENRREDVAPLAGLSAKFGVFGVPGNHEYYSGADAWTQELRKLGIRFLVNENASVRIGENVIEIVGLDDLTGRRFGSHGPDLELALAGAPASDSAPVILLSHQPITARKIARSGKIDLQLSGHTHGGMILGLDRLVAIFNGGFVRGLYDVSTMKLFVSPGTSIWNGFPLRIGTQSEITEIILRAEPAQGK